MTVCFLSDLSLLAVSKQGALFGVITVYCGNSLHEITVCYYTVCDDVLM